MNQTNTLFQKLKPSIPKRYLLFVAAMVWTFAGVMLMFRGMHYFIQETEMNWMALIISITAGIIFYALVFSRVSLKHSLRIINLPNERPCLFSFFSLKSYVLMTIMISTGVTVRVTGIVAMEYLSPFYITMGLPLFLSALRFLYFGFNYQKTKLFN